MGMSYRISRTHYDDIPYYVEIISYGAHAHSRFCRDIKEVKVYLESWGLKYKSGRITNGDR